MHDSLLLKLTPGRLEGESTIAPVLQGSRRWFGQVPVTLDEPNVLLLDMAEFSLDGGVFEPAEEILRLENICRGRIGTMLKKRAIPQPYQLPEDTPSHEVTLRFILDSEVEIASPVLALEDPQETTIILNGQKVSTEVTGWYVDHFIKTVALPDLHKGQNELLITRPVGLRTTMEACYLLGEFGVHVRGSEKLLTEPVRTLAFGTWTQQGLPFYGGNVTYHLEAELGEEEAVLRCPHYRGALMRVAVDGEDLGPVIYSPYQITLPKLTPGKHRIDITVYGSRQNTFAPLHHLSTFQYSQGPDAYRSTGDLWNYEYAFADKGLLSSPRLY